MELTNCPHCKSSLIGEPIPAKDQKAFGGAQNFKREIGIEYPELYDGVWEWKCPDCSATWDSKVKKLKGVTNV